MKKFGFFFKKIIILKKNEKFALLFSNCPTTMSCGKKINCPAFDQNSLALLIYKANDTIRFANKTDTLLLITQNITKSEEYSVKCKD